MKRKRHVCRRCGVKFRPKDEILLCAYCREVVLAEEDEDWLPLLKLGNINKKSLTLSQHFIIIEV